VNDCVAPASGRDSGPDNFHCRRDLTGIRHIQNDRLDGSHNPARPRLGQERFDIFLLSHCGQDAITVFRQGKGCRGPISVEVPVSSTNAATTIAGIELAHRIHKRQFSFEPGRPRRNCSLKVRWERALAWDASCWVSGFRSLREVGRCTGTQVKEADDLQRANSQPSHVLAVIFAADSVLPLGAHHELRGLDRIN